MISIVICSRNATISSPLVDNINSTIGVEYEWVVIDNSKNNYSIFSAYNEGVRRAKGEIICFIHDDVLIRTNNWGNVVESYFLENDDLGCLGVLGGHLLTKRVGYWNDGRITSGVHLQHSDGVIVKECYDKYMTDHTADVAACDGVWMCFRRSVFESGKLQFDESLGGFHMYDMDICVQAIRAGLTNKVTSRILIEHFNNVQKSFNATFYQSLQRFYEKWRKIDADIFPMRVGVSEKVVESVLLDEIFYSEKELNRIRGSKAYRLGKVVLKPFSMVRRLFK